MQLRFLGQTYSTDNNQVKTVASEHTARFRGQNYTLRVSTQIFKYQLGVSIRKYRGVFYIVETTARIAN